jgi:hypothetical protein
MRLFALIAAMATLIAMPALAQLNVSASGAFGHVALSSGFAGPYKITLQAGGEIAADTLADGCKGFIPDRALYSVDFTAGAQPLFFAATAAEDTTLVVRSPDGAWHCDDDSFGDRNPMVRIDAPMSGRYQVWIGVFSLVTGAPDAVLNVSEGAQPPKDDTSQFELH